MDYSDIINQLPYAKPFLFVDELLGLDEHGAKGTFTFSGDLDFYKGHFKEYPITPGVILAECCAQIGLVCLGIYLWGRDQDIKGSGLKIGLSSSEMDFYLPVLPNEKVTVSSKKVYFRFNKLKCEVKMYNSEEKLVCRGTMAGMLKTNRDA